MEINDDPSLYPGQMFGQLPSDATATEGSSANFSCIVLAGDSSRQDSVWGVQAPGEIEQILGINNVSMAELKDGSTAFTVTPFNSPLTIANVNRRLDGTQVRCLLLRNGIPISQDEPYAFLTVQCELFSV